MVAELLPNNEIARIEIQASQRRMRFPDSPLGGLWICFEIDSGCLARLTCRPELPDPIQRVLRPRFSVEKNRANSLVRLNANKHYQRFRPLTMTQLSPR